MISYPVPLPYDVARCTGKARGRVLLPVCRGCRRRELGRGEWQPYVHPAASGTGCENLIPREIVLDRDV